jgi:cytochrome c-type biogenesis protein CcsB
MMQASMSREPAPSKRGGFEGPLARVVVVVAIVVALLVAIKARGQTPAPAGNDHPQTAILAREGLANPFGEAVPGPSALSFEQKLAFSKAVNLEPLRDVAVGHNARVKILDTLAREVVGALTGRKDYFDVAPRLRQAEGTSEGGSDYGVMGGGELRYHYDPLFTLLDLVIDPSYYQQRPLIHVNYLPLRELILEAALPGEANAAERERLKRLGRLSPVMVAGAFDAVAERSTDSEAMQKAVNQLHEDVQLFALAAQTLNLIPPSDAASPWVHLSRAAEGSAARSAALELGRAWRAGDAAASNAAIAKLAAEMPAMNPAVYPGTRRAVERMYNASNAFEYGFWLYAMALLSLLLSFGTGRRWLLWLGVGFLAGAVSLHAFGFIARCVIAERFAIQNQFESMTGVSLFAAIVGLGLALVKRQALFAAATAAVGFMVLVTATQTGIPGYTIEREAAILNTSVLLKYHVTTVLVSYGLIALGCVISLFYLATYYVGKARERALTPASGGLAAAGAAPVSAAALGLDEARQASRARVLADLDAAQMTVLQLAFWTLGVGILLGAWWADHSWGRWWAFDPKELWALLTWIVYLVVVHLRFSSVRNKALTTAWLSVLGFIVMLWCYFGVNLLLPGLHAYA